VSSARVPRGAAQGPGVPRSSESKRSPLDPSPRPIWTLRAAHSQVEPSSSGPGAALGDAHALARAPPRRTAAGPGRPAARCAPAAPAATRRAAGRRRPAGARRRGRRRGSAPRAPAGPSWTGPWWPGGSGSGTPPSPGVDAGLGSRIRPGPAGSASSAGDGFRADAVSTGDSTVRSIPQARFAVSSRMKSTSSSAGPASASPRDGARKNRLRSTPGTVASPSRCV
jgi:hypothetical protein